MCILALLVQAVKFIGFRDISLHQVYRKLQSPSMLLFTLSELINCSAVYAASTYITLHTQFPLQPLMHSLVAASTLCTAMVPTLVLTLSLAGYSNGSCKRWNFVASCRGVGPYIFLGQVYC